MERELSEWGSWMARSGGNKEQRFRNLLQARSISSPEIIGIEKVTVHQSFSVLAPLTFGAE